MSGATRLVVPLFCFFNIKNLELSRKSRTFVVVQVAPLITRLLLAKKNKLFYLNYCIYENFFVPLHTQTKNYIRYGTNNLSSSN